MDPTPPRNKNLKTTLVSYNDQETALEAFVAFPAQEEKRPVVLFCHAWSGRDEYICEKAETAAQWGYIGFALDVYGKGVRGISPEENAALKAPFLRDRAFLQRRLLKGLAEASKLPNADSKRIAVVGFGFGGLCSLDLVRASANLLGAVSVYGHFEPSGLAEQPIKAKILLLHGMDDPIVPIEELLMFTKKMTEQGVDCQAHLFGGGLHAFTNPQANNSAKGMMYSPLATSRSMRLIKSFLQEIFGEDQKKPATLQQLGI